MYQRIRARAACLIHRGPTEYFLCSIEKIVGICGIFGPLTLSSPSTFLLSFRKLASYRSVADYPSLVMFKTGCNPRSVGLNPSAFNPKSGIIGYLHQACDTDPFLFLSICSNEISGCILLYLGLPSIPSFTS